MGEWLRALSPNDFSLPDSAIKLFPNNWTSVLLRKERREDVLEPYPQPNNYKMEIPETPSRFSGEQYRLDVVLKKQQMHATDILRPLFHALVEVDKEEVDWNKCSDALITGIMMTMNMVGSVHQSRLNNAKKWLGAETSKSNKRKYGLEEVPSTILDHLHVDQQIKEEKFINQFKRRRQRQSNRSRTFFPNNTYFHPSYQYANRGGRGHGSARGRGRGATATRARGRGTERKSKQP